MVWNSCRDPRQITDHPTGCFRVSKQENEAASRVVLDKDKQRQFATTALAMGVSLRQAEDLLGVLLPKDKVPDHSTLGRWVADRGQTRRRSPDSPRPGLCRPGRRPSRSTRSFLGAADLGWDRACEHDSRLLPERQGPIGRDLEATIGAVFWSGIRSRRRRQGDRLGGVLNWPRPVRSTRRPWPWHRAWTSSTPRWRPRGFWPNTGVAPRRRGRLAEAADAKVADAKQQGLDARGVAVAARNAWAKATAKFEQTERVESAWARAHAAFDRFTPDGRLNDRTRAVAEITAAVGDLTGPDWSKVRNFLNDPRSLAFLDRMQSRLETAEPNPEWREALAWRWWLRHRRPKLSDALTELLRAVGRDGTLSEPEQSSYARVASVLEDTFRASSAVECMNSVLRMQQSRHRQMTQPMLDLKRLYWNTRAFRSGPRKQVCPYQRLGLTLPTYRFLGAAPVRSKGVDAKTVNSWKCGVRQSQQQGGYDSHATRTMHAAARCVGPDLGSLGGTRTDYPTRGHSPSSRRPPAGSIHDVVN